jgi:tetratricopeptide (TPR) repeat protein
MRRLNVRLLLCVLGGVVLLSGAVFAVHQLQAGSISDGLLWQARQAEKEGRLSQAARYLGRYLEFVPNDLDSRAHYGKLIADPRLAVSQRARNRARYVLEQVLTRDPNRHDVRRCLVRMALDLRDFELAEEHLKYLQQALPDDGDVAGLVGQWEELKGNGDTALASLRRSVKSSPGSVDNCVRLINLLRRLDRGQRGEHFKEAEACLAAALAHAPDDGGVLLAGAELAGDGGDLTLARTRVERALKLNAAEPQGYLVLARVELVGGKRPEAVAALKRGLQAVARDDRYELHWMLANVLIDAGELEEAKGVIALLHESNPAPGAADYLRARSLMQQGRWFDASRLLERVRSAFKSVPVLAVQVELQLAACYERIDEPALQLAACRRAVELDPASVAGRQGIAAARLALGQPDAAIAEYREVVKLNEQLKAPVTGRVELAKLLLARTLQTEPRDWGPVALELDAAAKEQPDAVEVPLLRAEMYAAQKKMDDAQAVLLLAIGKQPKRVEFWTALAALAERNGEPDKARELLNKAQEQAGDAVELRLARAAALAAKPGADTKAALCRLEEKLESFPPDKRDVLLNGLAEAQYRAGNTAEATRLWRRLAASPRHARNLRLRQLLFDLALRQEDDAAMRQALDDIKTIEEGESALWLFGQASRQLVLARRGDRKALGEARGLLERVVSLRPAWPAVLLAKAELEELQGNVEQAITQYRRALEHGVNGPRVVRRLVQLLSSRQRYDEAEQEMQKLRQTTLPDAERLRLVIGLALSRNDFHLAEELVREAGADASQDYRDHLWVGQVLAASGRSSEAAEKALRRAVELSEGAPETWVALVQYLIRAGDGRRAQAEIEQARAKLTGAKGSLALAQCYELVGQADKAREQYQAALRAASGEFQYRRAFVAFCLRTGTPQQAEAHLRDILARKTPVADADAAWARRALALTLASAADHKRFREALELVGLSLDDKGLPVEPPAPPGGWPLEEQVTRARVLATQPRRALRARAVALLEEIHKRASLPPDEQMLLAQLYNGMGDDEVWWGKAREQMQTLTTTHGRNPLYLSYYAQSLLQHGDVGESERVIGKLEQVEKGRKAPPGALGSVELKALALERRGRGSDALALLKDYAETADAPPERTLLYAGLHGRLGNVKEALDLCDGVRTKCPPEAVGGASVALLRAALLRPQQTSKVWREEAGRVEGWLKEALARSPESVALRLELADLMDLLDRGAEVEALYREVLKNDPRNHVALNNLSWLLALRKDPKALELVQQAIEAHGERPELLDTRGYIYLQKGEVKNAIPDLERAVRDAPTPVKFVHLIQAHHQARDRRAALAALTRAQDAGLSADRLPPAERAAYNRLLDELKQ